MGLVAWSRRVGRLVVALTAAVVFGGAAQAQSAPKWRPSIDFEVKPGTKRGLGEADLFVPVAQTGTTLLFGSLRGRLDDNENREGNFGLGLRHMLPSDWNLGVYGYYDHRRSGFDHYFNQATLGFEALGRDWDVRANVYVPFGERVKSLGTTGGGDSTASVAGAIVQVTTPGTQTREERALRGFDAEIGWRVPVFPADADKALRLYAGVFHFDDGVVEAVTGPRLRAELTMYEVPGLREGTRLTLGAEFQHDDVRGSQGFALARLSIPLFPIRGERKLTAQERRMTDRVVRDVDIVTKAHTVQTPSLVETATVGGSGSPIAVLDSATVTGANLPAAVVNAGANATVILKGTFNTTASISTQTGQTLMGAGTLAVQTASGRTAELSMPGGTIAATINGITLFATNNVTISGLTISNILTSGTATGINVTGTGVVIANNTITTTSAGTGSSSTALAVSVGAAAATVIGNTITATANGGTLTNALFIARTATVTGNTLSATGASTNRYLRLSGATVGAGSTGNVAGSGTCLTNNTGTGSVFFDNAAACAAGP
jgi:hypothetical protein